jgi:hypothetical protein
MTRIVACLDGLDPVYLDAIATPEWEALDFGRMALITNCGCHTSPSTGERMTYNIDSFDHVGLEV